MDANAASDCADASDRWAKLGIREMTLTAKTNNRIKMILLNFIIILLFIVGGLHSTTGLRLTQKYNGTIGFTIYPEIKQMPESILNKNDAQLAGYRAQNAKWISVVFSDYSDS